MLRCAGPLAVAIFASACAGEERAPAGAAGVPPGEDAALPASDRGPDRQVELCARYGLGRVGRVAVSPDGATVVAGGVDLALAFTRADSAVSAFYPVDGAVEALAYAPAGTTLAVAAGGRVSLFDAATGALEATLELESESAPLAVAFAPDGARLAVADLTRLRLYTLPGLTLEHELQRELGWSADRIAFASDGSLLLRTLEGIDRLDPASFELMARVASPAGRADSPLGRQGALAVGPDGWLASGGPDGAVRVWRDAGGAEPVLELAITGAVDALAISDDGAVLAAISAHEHGNLRAWTLPSGVELLNESLAEFLRELDHGAGVRFEPGGRHLFVNDAHSVLGFDLERRERVERYGLGHAHWLEDMAVSPDGRSIASAGRDRVIVWDKETEAIVSSATVTAFTSNQVAFSPDGARLYGSVQGMLFAWDAATGELLQQSAELHRSLISELAVSPDGATLLAAVTGHELVMVSAASLEPLFRVPAPESSAPQVAFSPNGRAFVAATRVDVLEAFDASDGAALGSVTVEGVVLAMRFIGDGSRLLVAAAREILVYTWPELGLLQPLEPAEPSVHTLVPLADGRHVLSLSGIDSRVALWDVPALRLVREGRQDANRVPRIGLPAGLDAALVLPRADALRLYCTGPDATPVTYEVW